MNEEAYWQAHSDDPIWEEVNGLTLCSCSYKVIMGVEQHEGENNCADRTHWYELAQSYITAKLNSLKSSCDTPYPTDDIIDTFYQAGLALDVCEIDKPEWSLLTRDLDEWNAGDYEGGPVDC